MDKFGIFKLLNSFFDFYKKNSTASGEEPVKDNGGGGEFSAQETPRSQAFKPSVPPLFSSPKAQETPEKKPKKIPLQQNMLNVINSHDQLVRRIKNKN